MVKASLKKVFIKNFKSLHDCEIDIGKMNVVVGANASGKSNLIEAFRLLKKIYVEKDPFPFLEWWDYNNVVWQRREELPIIIGLLFDIEGYEVYFETTFTGIGGKFRILSENIDIKGYLKIEKDSEWIAVKHNPEFIENLIQNLDEYDIEYGGKTILKREKNKLVTERKVLVDLKQSLLDPFIPEYGFSKHKGGASFNENKGTNEYLLSYIWFSDKSRHEDEKVFFLCPAIHFKDRYKSSLLYEIAAESILTTIRKLLILYPLNIRSMKNPQPFRREETPKEDGTNIASVYHTIYLKEGKIPDEIYNPLSMVFPKIDVRPHITDDGRVMIKFFEDGFGLLPPNTSDGIYKILTVLIAIYLKPPLLIIDEIENSLHPETLELILDTIKASDIQAIITTHSPVVVDMTEPDDMVLVEKEQGESRFKRIKDPDKIRDFLKEKGITFSTGWLYGEISHIE